MFILKTKQTRQTDGEAMVQCSLDSFRVLSLNFGGKWKKLAESRIPEIPTFRMYAPDQNQFDQNHQSPITSRVHVGLDTRGAWIRSWLLPLTSFCFVVLTFYGCRQNHKIHQIHQITRYKNHQVHQFYQNHRFHQNHQFHQRSLRAVSVRISCFTFNNYSKALVNV